MADIVSTPAAVGHSRFEGIDSAHRLVGTLCENTDRVNAAIFIPNTKAIVSVSNDKNIRVWLNTQDIMYDLVICKELPSACTSVCYDKEYSSLYIGEESGTISQYALSDDCKELTFARAYLGHKGRVTKVVYSPEHNWILSCGLDKRFAYHCSKTLEMVGEFEFRRMCTCLDFNAEKRNAFVGTYGGKIFMLRCETDDTLLEKLFIRSQIPPGSTVSCVKYDRHREVLYSGCFERCVLVWDVTSENFPEEEITFRMTGHTYDVTSIYYIKRAQILISGGGDNVAVFWDLNFTRKNIPEWLSAENCYLCKRKYLYTFVGKGLREENCLNCGQSVCPDCSSKESYNPTIGYELKVRCCDICVKELNELKQSTGRYELRTKCPILNIDFDEEKKRLITVGKDNCIRIWDLSRLLKY